MHQNGRKFGLVVTALTMLSFAALAQSVTVGVSNVVSRQRYPWNGLVDIDCEISCSDPAPHISLSLSVMDNAANRSLPVRHVWLESDATHTNALVVKTGKHRIVWDAGTDASNVVSGDVTIDVQARVRTGNYLVIKLSGGPDAASYPMSYLDAEPQGGWTDEYKTEKLVLRRIQPGTFTMGCETTEVGYGGTEAVPHPVMISHPFYMGVFEVTQRQYQLVMGTNPSSYKGDMRPVEYVSWNTIRGISSTYNWPNVKTVAHSTFIGKLRAKTGLEGFDLPTEAQWEYACRAGTTTALNNGKNLTSLYQDSAMDEVGRYGYNNGYQGGTKDGKGGYSDYHTTVGSYKPNDLGLYDMHGNVWEWCLDWHTSRSEFTSAAVTDPVGSASGSFRVIRGGGWYNSAQDCRSANRVSAPAGGGDNLGFRLCCSAGLQ